MRQCAYDKFFYVASNISTKDKTKVDFMSQQRISLSPQKKLKVEVNVVVTKTTIITTEVEKNDKKIIATQKRMLRHNNQLKAEISVAT